jgi:hypothetical protein
VASDEVFKLFAANTPTLDPLEERRRVAIELLKGDVRIEVSVTPQELQTILERAMLLDVDGRRILPVACERRAALTSSGKPRGLKTILPYVGLV